MANYPGAPSGDFDLYIKPSIFAKAFTGDLAGGTAATFAASQRPLTLGALSEKSGPPAWSSIPSWSVVGTEDQIIPPAAQLEFAKRAHAHVTEVKAPHLSMVTNPEAVTGVILEAASSVK
jgi:pimeloyl-ACP methyl ester carboxylesterase